MRPILPQIVRTEMSRFAHVELDKARHEGPGCLECAAVHRAVTALPSRLRSASRTAFTQSHGGMQSEQAVYGGGHPRR